MRAETADGEQASSEIRKERDRRRSIWLELLRRGGPSGISPSLIRELRIHRGQQGIFRDHDLTSRLTADGSGAAIGLLHTGRVYEDDLSEDGVIWHRPVTNRGTRDASEVAAILACKTLRLPVFVITASADNPSLRDVRVGQVVDFDVSSELTLILFVEGPDASPVEAIDPHDEPFQLQVERERRTTTAPIRPGQARFRFQVLKRYGSRCSFCGVTIPALLQTAHLCPVSERGTDDPRNALVLCFTHHKAFDVGLIRVHPDTLKISSGAPDVALEALAVTNDNIEHLPMLPHREALAWAWENSAKRSRRDQQVTM